MAQFTVSGRLAGLRSEIGMGEVHSVDYLIVYPVPTLDELNVEFDASVFGGGILDLLDLQGQKVLSRSLDSERGFVQLDVSTMPKGVYFLSVRGRGNSKTVRIVVQ